MPDTKDSTWQLKKYCRTCATELVTGVHIFGNEGKRLRISEKLRTTLSVLVLEEDLLPKRICTNCCLSLEEFSQYKEAVIDAQDKLRGIAKNLQILSNKEKEAILIPTASSSSSSSSSAPAACKDCGKKLSGSACLETHRKQEESDDNDAVEGEPIATHDDDMSDENEAGTVLGNVVQPPIIALDLFPCDFCDEAFPMASAYYAHLAVKHKGKKYPCSFCPVSYAQKASLTVHIRTHHSAKEKLPPKTHTCPVCPVAFYEKKDLTRHARTHITDREFPCYICNKFYKTSKCLAKHISTHLNVDKFKCPICQKGFNKKAHLTEHENTHSPNSSLGCPFCIKTFNNYPNYLKHLRRLHDEKWIAGEKAPPPIRNVDSDVGKPTTPEASLPPPLAPAPSTTVNVTSASVWTETTPTTTSSSRQIFHVVNTVEGVEPGVQNSSSGAGQGIPMTEVGSSSVQEIVHVHDPNQPMELCYKITSSDFQDMPMELTKVFQESGPLELCVRTDAELSQLITSANPKEPHNCNGKFDLIDLSTVAPFQQQPMDLINRDSCYNLSSVNNSMDLSLRSSFSDQSTNSFIRELLDLSSRSEAYHHEPQHHHHSQSQMELNLSSTKHPQPYRSAPPSHPTTHNFLNVYSDNLFN